MKNQLKQNRFIKKIRKTKTYSRFRQHLRMPEFDYIDDRDEIEDAEIIKIVWPENVKKPTIGIVKDKDNLYPRWTKYCRFFENNSFRYGFVDIHAHHWIEEVNEYDIIVGFFSSAYFDLIEIRNKYYFLETFLNKTCYPSSQHANLYENKRLEAYLASVYNFPFVKTTISHDKTDALQLIKKFNYPIVSKIDPSSGSSGVEMVISEKQATKIVEQAFSNVGRKTHMVYFRQSNYVYFQDYVPNDGYDIRVIVVGNMAFGYYRKILKGDFRASGMDQVEMRELPADAIKIAWRVNKIIKSPMLVVDMVRGFDGKFRIIEYSPTCLMEKQKQLLVNDVPGAYILDSEGNPQFKPGKFWVHELALKEFLLNDYLPKVLT